MIETKYVVNGVEYTDLAEAEAASKKFEEEQAAKKDAALARKADAEQVKQSALKYLELVAENKKKKEELQKAEEEAYNAYFNELTEFSKKHNGYRLTFSSDGENLEFKIEEVRRISVEEELENLRKKFGFFRNLWF